MSGPARWALSPLDCRAHLRAGEPPPGVLTARCGGVLPTVGVQYSDRPSGSLVCPVCADIADGGDPIAGWPPVELPLSPLAPGGQPVPSHARETPVRSGALPAPRRCSPSWAPWWPGWGTAAAEVAWPRWGCRPADRRLHLLDPTAVRQARAVGGAQALCGRLTFRCGAHGAR